MVASINDILKFLHAYGYLALPGYADNSHLQGNEPAGFMGKWTPAAEEALDAYQKYHRLPQISDPLSEVHRAHMCQRRCNCPDRPYALSEAQTMKWNKFNLTYKFLNLSNDLPQNMISDSWEKGFGVWAACTPLTFREVLANEPADIAITFDKIDGQSNVLAQTWFPPVGKMEFDDSEMWSWVLPIGRGQVDLATVVAHEAGHLIGLEHSQVPGAQMAPVYAGPKRFLEQDDIRRAQQLYGPR